MYKRLGVVSAIVLAMGSGGCEDQSRGFAFPPGDTDRGKAAFVELGCPACHAVQGEFKKLGSDQGGATSPGSVIANARMDRGRISSVSRKYSGGSGCRRPKVDRPQLPTSLIASSSVPVHRFASFVTGRSPRSRRRRKLGPSLNKLSSDP